MDEVTVDPVDVRRELVELIELLFSRAPVELLMPVRGQFPEIREVRPVVPLRPGDLPRESCACEALLEIREDRISDVDLEWDDGFLARRQDHTRQDEHQRQDEAFNHRIGASTWRFCDL